MGKNFKKFFAAAAAMAICTGSAANCLSFPSANAAYGVGGNGKAIMEYLDRGIYAVKNGNGMFVSWRYNANDSDTAEFRLYRDDKLIYTSKSGDPTCYQDNGGTASSKYRVDCLDGGKVTSSENCKFTSGNNYFDIKLNSPGSQYSPNDCCVGDVDGDGQYEIFLKWDPSNAKDNSQSGATDNVIIDCYTLTGKQLWRIDLGRNIRAGQHYTQMCVADFDCDGKAELITKTSEGTKDGTGKVIGNASKSYANSSGYILDGPEYLTLFDGQTGKNLDTIDFPVPRGKVSDWGDNYGNRVDRMNSAIAYLDGVHPSAVYGRGYYTRLTLSAFDVQNKKLIKRWIYDTGNNKSAPGWGCGNHNVMVADVDDDGRQEVCMGASMIDDNGKLLWSTGTLHGDAMHLGDLIPDRAGQELWICHEDKPYGESCIDAKTGKTIFHVNGTKDTGRCAADNIWAGNKGAEFWGAADGNVYNTTGKKVGGTRPAQNFFIYWDGDLEREILDGTKISKMTAADKISTVFTANGCSGNNSSKNVPCITADLFGDWREELIMRTSDNTKLRIWCTTDTTKVRLTTLMHDMQYRMQNGCQQSCYNQPPHVSYYLGSDAPIPARPKVLLNNNGTVVTPPTTTPTTNPPSVTPVNKKFDLGANAQNGFTSVSAAVKYDKNKGYGFSGNDVKDVAASGKNELSDAVQFTGNTTFNVDLPNGLYKVKVTLGNTQRTSVYMENLLQIVNMTGNNAVDEILIPITDGQLNIRAAAGKSGYAYTISSLEISKVSDEAVLPPTIWLCGDSTVCNYYPLNTSTQAGWGQMLGGYVDKNWNIRNMAAGGQYAKGFVDAGQFDAIEKYGKKGDVYIISIGINDTNYSDKDEYYKTVTDMTKRAKAKGMDVILVKQQGRNGDAQKKPLLTSRWFAAQLDQVGKEQNCQVVDLFNLWQNYCISVGADKTTAMYMTGDQLHPNRSGAAKLAELFASQFKQTPGTVTPPTTNPPTTNPPVVVDPAADIIDGTVYTIKNVNSGMYLDVNEAKAENGANVQQWSSISGDNNKFKAVSAGNGYFYLISQLGDGNSFALDVSGKKADDGTNISIYTFNKGDNQQFKFVKNNNGSYSIRTKVSNDASCIEVVSKSTEAGANVQEWTFNGGNNQNWYVEPVSGTQQPTQPQPPTSDFILGDLTKDNTIDVFDLILMRQELISSKLDAAGKDRADINSDGIVTIADAVELEKFLLTGQPFSSGNQGDPVQSKSLVYASDMKINSGVTEDTNAGFKGNSYVNLNNMTGSSIEWTVNVAQDGNYLCSFNNANGTTANRSMKIEVNNNSDYWMQDFLSTGDWTTWKETGIVLPLKKGTNKILMTSATDQGGPNLDYLKTELTDEPIAEVYIPQNNTNTNTPDKNAERTIYIAGDSTVQTYRESYAPQQGWGAYLGDNLSDKITVSNHAIAGRSSKSFYDNGRLDTILGSIKKGDQFLIQFGINDSASSNAERYAPVSGKVPGTSGSFEDYIAKYIEGAKAKGAQPILVTTVIGLKAYNNNTKKFENSYTNYCNAMKKLGSYYNIPVIDLNSLMVAHYNSIGYDAAYKYHMCSTGSTDMTHFTEAGAKAAAKLVADELKNQGLV